MTLAFPIGSWSYAILLDVLIRAVARNGSVGGVGTNFADRRAWSRVWSREWLLLCSAARGGFKD